MSSGSSVQVPIARPAGYAPAWAEKPAGVRVSRTLDIADLLASRQLHLVNAAVALDPPLYADSFFTSDVAVSFFVADVPSAIVRTRCRVRFDLQYSDGSADRIVVFQPIAPPDAPGLVAADTTGALLSVGGDLITIGGQPIFTGTPGSTLTAAGEMILIGGQTIRA